MNDTYSDSLVMSYLDLRKSVGVIGIALPFVLVIGKIVLESPGLLPSISAYYYSIMGNVFVGSLCAIAVFLMSYRGYTSEDSIAGKIACAFALGTALFPTAPSLGATAQQAIIGGLHFTFAMGLFLVFAYFSLVLFRRTDPARVPTRKKLQRNTVYTVCGYLILACIAGVIGTESFLRGTTLMRCAPIFWLESIAIISFGTSWLIKGETLLKDETPSV